MPKRRMTFIDALRGLAALSVMAVHCDGVIFAGSRSGKDTFSWLSAHAHIFARGVDVFFVISGFVIAQTIANAEVTSAYACRFALRRSFRLDPPYWVAIALAIVVKGVRHKFGNEQIPLPSASQIAAHLFYLQLVLHFEPLNGVFWTLCLEVQFYIVFVLLIMASERIWRRRSVRGGVVRAWATALAFIVSLLWVSAILPTNSWITVYFGPHWHKFLIGALIWYAWAGYLPRYMLFLPVAVLGLAVSLHRLGLQALGHDVGLGLWVGLATAVAFVAAAVNNGFYRWLDWRILQFLGLISYSIYLVHVPLIEIVLGIQKRLVLGSPSAAIAFIITIYIFSIAMGWVMNVVIERPSIRLASKFKPRDKAFTQTVAVHVPEAIAIS